MKTLLCLLSAAPLGVLAGCMPITGDRILGRDLALADPRFAGLPSSYIVGSAPAPGSKRTFSAAELTRIARQNAIVIAEPAEICFEIPLRPLEREEALIAMRRVLPGAEVVVAELSKEPVPAGTAEFPLTGLEPARAGSLEGQVWHGFVRYSESRRVPVWAHVSISQTLTAVVAQRDLAPNVPIDATALRIEKRQGPAVAQVFAIRLEDVIGKIPKRAVRAGALIPLSLLEQAPDIRRGDAVQVDVLCGLARLKISAIAERDGRNGEMLELRNPSTGKTFRAKLDGPRAVLVVATGGGQ